MAQMTVSEFVEGISAACRKSNIVANIKTELHENIVAKIRVFLIKDCFADVFYNSDTDRIDFALIRNSKRIYGADNLGGWHYHPFEDPEKHIACETMNFADFLGKVREILQKF